MKEKKRKEKGETQDCMHVYECVPETRRMLEGEKKRRQSVSLRQRVGEREDVQVVERKREESGIELSPPSLAC